MPDFWKGCLWGLGFLLLASLIPQAIHRFQATRSNLRPGQFQLSLQSLRLDSAFRRYQSQAWSSYLCTASKPLQRNCPAGRITSKHPLVKALVFQEDQQFYNHAGFSTRELRVSILDWLWHDKRLRGASTITQQLARTLFLVHYRSYLRKFVELRMARLLENKFSKDQILELYLNSAYFGRGAFGIAQAAQIFFKKSPDRLSQNEIAFLIARLPSPEICMTLRGCHNKGFLIRYNRLSRELSRMSASNPITFQSVTSSK